MKLSLIAVLIIVGLVGIVVIGINFKHLRKHSCEGKLGIPSGFIFLISEALLFGIGLLTLISYFK